jgi:RNA polymerase sigma-70 factor, ECF subfamily
VSELEAAARRVAEGDGGAFRAIVDATGTRLYRLAVRMVGDRDDADDVLQDAYVRAHQALSSGGWDGRATIATWLYRIVVNTALNFRRGSTRREKLMDARQPSAPAQETQVEVRQLVALLKKLPDEQRAAIVLKEVEGLSAAEIAEICSCSEGAVEQRLVRARASLRMRWNP